MAIILPELGLAIYTSPKVVSTSLKLWAFEVENGYPFTPFTAGGQTKYVHHLYPAKPFKLVDTGRFPHIVCFVRDPVERFMSLYRNRVVRKHVSSDLDWRRASDKGLASSPTLEQFIQGFRRYRSTIADIRHHAALQTQFVGTEPAVFERVFTDHTVHEFEDFVGAITGQKQRLPWEQKSESTNTLGITIEQEQWIRRRYRQDYKAFGKYFSPDTDPNRSLPMRSG